MNSKVFIPLTKGQIAIIDLDDYELINKYTWCAKVAGRTYYAMTSTYNKNYKSIFSSMHRVILNPKKNEVVDHLNGNGLDNRKCNLRICSQQENLFNQQLRVDNTSGYKGVTWDKSNNKWLSQIQINKKNIKLGRFLNIEDAIKARKEAEIQLFKSFRRE